MNFNIYFTLTLLSGILLNVNSKKCCDKNCSTAISMGRAITTFQDHYPGFLTYLSGDQVTVLSKDRIQGIEFWEAEIGGKTGFIEAAAVKEYSAICTPVEINDGVHYFSKTLDNADKANVLSSERVVDNYPNDQTPWYGILWFLFTDGAFDGIWNSLTYRSDLDAIIEIFQCYTYGDRMGVAIALFIALCTIYFNLRLKTEMNKKDDQIAKLVERAADVAVNNFDLNIKLKDTKTLVKDLEEKLHLLSKEKDVFEQNKNDQRIKELNLEYLRDKVQQLEMQVGELQGENSKLLANNHCASNIANLIVEKEALEDSNNKLKDHSQQLEAELKWNSKQLAERTSHCQVLEAIKDQLEDDRHRLETELSQKDKQIAKITSTCKVIKTIIQQLKAEAESRNYNNADDGKTVEDFKKKAKVVQSDKTEFTGVENLEANSELSGQGMAHFKESSEVQKQLTEIQCQCEDYKSKLQEVIIKLKRAQSDHLNREEHLELTQKELEVCETHLAKEKAKCEVIVEFYKDTLHTHSCSYLRSDANIHLTAYKQNQELKDQVQTMEAEMRNMELSYITKLNWEMKQNIEGLETLQIVEGKLYKSQQELTQSQRRIAELELQSSLSSIQGKRLKVTSN